MGTKKILFITHRYPKGKNTILEKDAAKALSKIGYKVVVVTPIERKLKKETHIIEDDGIEILYVKTGNYLNEVPKLEKVFTVLTRPYLMGRAIKKYYSEEKFNMIFGYTPFMANYRLFSKLKEKYNAKLFLFLWDIFPQNGKDLGMFKNKILFKFLKFREKMMYKTFDKVICNCEGQIEYVLKNKYKLEKDLVLIRNSEFFKEKEERNKGELKEELGYKKNDIISIFGGNMGEPQELENIVNMIKELKEYNQLKFIFLGNGTQKNRIKSIKLKNQIENLEILDFVEREKYEKTLCICDIGLISLNKKYTVPNFPAKVTGYVKEGIPIFASLDGCSKKYLGQFIEQNEIGVVVEAGNQKEMKNKFLNLVENITQYKYDHFKNVYFKNFDVDELVNKIQQGVDESNV